MVALIAIVLTVKAAADLVATVGFTFSDRPMMALMFLGFTIADLAILALGVEA